MGKIIFLLRHFESRSERRDEPKNIHRTSLNLVIYFIYLYYY